MNSVAERRRHRIWLTAVIAYLSAVWIATWYFRINTFDYRNLEAHRLDTAWQLELVWQAQRGQWVGRDLIQTRGPLWQLIALAGVRDSSNLARSVAGLEAAFQLSGVLLCAIIAHLSLAHARAKIFGFLLLSSLAFGAGIATFRGVLSLAIIVFFAPRVSERSGSVIGSGALVAVAMWLSVDRALLGLASVAAMASYEFLVCLLRREPGQALGKRLTYFGVGFGGGVLATCAVAASLGISPWAYLRSQYELAGAYVNLAASWDAGVRVQNVLGLLIAAAIAAVAVAVIRRLRTVSGQWLVGALVCASFAVILPDAGHVYLALMPLLGVLFLAALQRDEHPAVRATLGLLGTIAVLGWMGARPTDWWTSPSSLVRAVGVYQGKFKGDPNFETDVSRVVRFAKASSDACTAFAPALTIAHALANMPGPTELTLRWNEPQQKALAQRIQDAGCPRYVHQLMAFDSERGSSWLLGPDFVALSELYAAEQWLGPATLVLSRRPQRATPERTGLLGVSGKRTLAVPGNVALPLGAMVSGETLVRIKLALGIPNWAVRLGAVPELSYVFERHGKALSEPRPLFHAAPNVFGDVYVAIDPTWVEERWLAQRAIPEGQADAIRIFAKPRGRLHPASVLVDFAFAEALHAPKPAPTPTAKSCVSSLDLRGEVAAGRAVGRMVHARAEADGFSLHPNPYPESRAELFFPVRACNGTCLSADLVVSSQHGDGVDFQAHIVESSIKRPLLFAHYLTPGQARHVEVALPGGPSAAWIRLGTLNHEDTTADYSFVAHPRLRPCSARGPIFRALDEKLAKREGEAVYREAPEEIAFGPLGGAVRLPIVVTRDTCLSVELETRAMPSTRFEYYVWLVDGDVEHRLMTESVPGGSKVVRDSLALFDWDSRRVEILLVAFARNAAPTTRGVFTRAELHTCGGT